MSFLLHPRSLAKVAASGFWAMAITICINDKLAEICAVHGKSMAPTLSPLFNETGRRDYILLWKWNPTKNLKRGDVVSFSPPHRPEGFAVKRVVALEGDWVDLDWRRRPLNGKKAEQWDLMGSMHERSLTSKRRVKVPYGHVWVEGDNWEQSHDSNYYGPISKSLISGKAICIVLPFARFAQTPWEEFKGKTKVKLGKQVTPIEWSDL